MKNRLTRLLRVLERYPRSSAHDLRSLADELGTTPETIRRDLRDLREAGAPLPVMVHAARASDAASVTPTDGTVGSGPPAPVPPQAPANDGATAHPWPLGDEEYVAMYLGALELVHRGDSREASAAREVRRRVERVAPPPLQARLDALEARFWPDSATSSPRIHQLIGQAITERRVLRIEYRGSQDAEHLWREVEPLAQFYLDGRWSFLAHCRTRGEIRQFRHERCREVAVTDRYFDSREGFSLEAYLERRRRRAQPSRAASR